MYAKVALYIYPGYKILKICLQKKHTPINSYNQYKAEVSYIKCTICDKQYKGPLTAVPTVSMTVLPNFPCLYRGFLCV